MYRIAHISDLHYTTANRSRVRSVLEAACRSGADHLAITGDLTEDATDVHMRGLKSLLESYGFADGDRLTVIPGNHDIFGFVYQTFPHAGAVVGRICDPASLLAAIKRLNAFRKKLLSFDKTYDKALQRFMWRFERAFDGILTPNGKRWGFPFVKLLPGNTAIIGVDSCQLPPRLYGPPTFLRSAYRAWRTHDVSALGENLSGSTGKVDHESLDAVLSMPEVKHRRKIVIMHHYMNGLAQMTRQTSAAYANEMRLVNQEAVAGLLGTHGVELVLHGHEHVVDDYLLDGGTRVLNAGGADTPGINCLEVSPQTLRVVSPYLHTAESLVTRIRGTFQS